MHKIYFLWANSQGTSQSTFRFKFYAVSLFSQKSWPFVRYFSTNVLIFSCVKSSNMMPNISIQRGRSIWLRSFAISPCNDLHSPRTLRGDPYSLCCVSLVTCIVVVLEKNGAQRTPLVLQYRIKLFWIHSCVPKLRTEHKECIRRSQQLRECARALKRVQDLILPIFAFLVLCNRNGAQEISWANLITYTYVDRPC